MESQLFPAIDFLDRAFQVSRRARSDRSKLNHKSTSHDYFRIRTFVNGVVDISWRSRERFVVWTRGAAG